MSPDDRAPRAPTRVPIAFVIGVASLLLAVAPLAGLLGAVAVAIAARERASPRPRLRAAAIGAGGAALALGLAWAVALLEPPRPPSRASCPTVLAWDGAGYRLETGLVAGSRYPWAERREVDAAPHLAPASGVYRARVPGDAEGVTHVDSAQILIVDHRPGEAAVPTEGGAVVLVAAPPPLVRPALATREVSGARQDAWSASAPRPAGDRAVLLVQARTTPFAELAYGRYVARMGQGLDALITRSTREDCTDRCRQEVWDDELDRLGVRLEVGGAGVAPRPVGPFGAATLRTVAVPIELPPGAEGAPLALSARATAGFWEVVGLGIASAREVEPRAIAPRSATLARAGREEDVTALVAAADRRRVDVPPGADLDLVFDAPPPPGEGTARTALVGLRAWYTSPTGGHRGLDPAMVLAHRAGVVSLPRFAAGLTPR